MCNEIKGSYDKIIITIVPSYTRKNITRFLPLALLLVLHTRNNTDGNKLVIFSGIALYCGDNYIILYRSERYLGMWLNDKYHGPGILVSGDKSYYSGTFSNGEKSVRMVW